MNKCEEIIAQLKPADRYALKRLCSAELDKFKRSWYWVGRGCSWWTALILRREGLAQLSMAKDSKGRKRAIIKATDIGRRVGKLLISQAVMPHGSMKRAKKPS